VIALGVTVISDQLFIIILLFIYYATKAALSIRTCKETSKTHKKAYTIKAGKLKEAKS